MRALASALLLAALLLGLGALNSCAARTETGPALWRIADEDSAVWLFGTVHVLPRDLAWRTPRIDAAFAAAAELVTETEASPAAQAEIAALAAAHGALAPGETLSQRLDADQRARLGRVAALAGVDPATLEGLRPWLAALRLSLGFALSRGHAPEAGVETVLLADAAAQGKRLAYLETAEQQIRTLADLAPADEMRFFAAALRQIEDEPETLDAIDRAWARGDLAALSAQLDPQWREAGPAVYEALIAARNRAWADQIVRKLDGDEDVFVAVGAAHLVGEDSVIALLRARGLEVDGP